VHLAGNSVSTQGLARIEEWSTKHVNKEPLPAPPAILAEQTSHPPVNAQEKEELLQAKVQNSLLKKDIETLRHQCMSFQAHIQGSETQLSNCALRITELEQNLLRETTKNNHLHEALADSREKLATLTDEQNRCVSTWETERNEWAHNRKELIREKDAEIRALVVERDSLRELARKAEV
jgi:chromosome segregation ATPase